MLHLKTFRKINKLTDFDEGLFYTLVDRVKVNKDGITIIWKDGAES